MVFENANAYSRRAALVADNNAFLDEGTADLTGTTGTRNGRVAKQTELGCNRGKTSLGVGAAKVVCVSAGANAVSTWDHTNLGEGAADLTGTAPSGVKGARLRGGGKTFLGVRAAVFGILAHIAGGRTRGRTGGRARSLVPELHLNGGIKLGSAEAAVVVGFRVVGNILAVGVAALALVVASVLHEGPVCPGNVLASFLGPSMIAGLIS